MPDQKVCAACRAPAPDADNTDGLYVCEWCLGLHDQLAAAVPAPESPTAEPAPLPVARRVVEEPPAPAATQPHWSAAPLPAPRAGWASWRAVANGYWHLRDAMLIGLLGVFLAVVVRFVEMFLATPRRGYDGDPPHVSVFGSCVFLLTVGIVLAKLISAAVALAKKPSADGKKGLQLGLCVVGCIPGVNLFLFPPLLSLFTFVVGAELGKPTIRRAGWVLIVCSLVFITPLVLAVRSVLDFALDGAPTSNRSSTPAPVAAEVLFGVAAGAVLWLGAYIVTSMTLAGVARAIERALRVEPTTNDPAEYFDHLRDVLQPGESRENPT